MTRRVAIWRVIFVYRKGLFQPQKQTVHRRLLPLTAHMSCAVHLSERRMHSGRGSLCPLFIALLSNVNPYTNKPPGYTKSGKSVYFSPGMDYAYSYGSFGKAGFSQ